MEDTNTKGRGWTDGERMGVMIQLITKMGRVPWDDLEVPAGRTIKACQVMLDKEKSKIKKARESDAKSDDSANKEAGAGKKERAKAKKSSKQRAADEEDEDSSPVKKAPKSPAKMKKSGMIVKSKVEEDVDENTDTDSHV